MTAKILVIEDEPALQETLVYNLNRQGYTVEVAGDGGAALEAARRLSPDLIVLDLMLPVLDGFEVCRILRQEMNAPIIILTARDDEIDRVLGLELGADDYLTKPFSMRELLARVKAQLRRIRLIRQEFEAEAQITSDVLHLGNLTLDLNRHQAFLDEQPLSLKPKEFELLTYFAHHQGQALSRSTILHQVWGWDYTLGSRTVDVHVRWLRQKIEPDPAHPTRIVTIHGLGYRFEG